jgi:hypothetical protein
VESDWLINGEHVFRVLAMDNANAFSDVAVRSFTVDAVNQNPTVAILTGPSGNTADNTPTFTWQGTDNDGHVTGYYISIDENPPANWTTETSWTSQELTEGEHTFFIIAQDNEEANSSTASLSFQVVKGSKSLWVEITGGPQGDTTEQSPIFSYMGHCNSGSIEKYFVSIDKNPPDIETTLTAYSPGSLEEGIHVFYVMAQDDSGTNSAVVSRAFNIRLEFTKCFRLVWESSSAVGQGLKIHENKAYVADSDYDFRIYDISSPDNINLISRFEDIIGGFDVDIDGDYAYITEYAQGLDVVDISNSSDPRLVCHWEEKECGKVKVYNGYAYSSVTSNLHIFDISNPENISYVDTYTTHSDISEFCFSGDYMFLPAGNTVWVMDISNPENITEVGQCILDDYSSTSGACIQDSWIFPPL